MNALIPFSNLDLSEIEIVNPRKPTRQRGVMWVDPLGNQSGVRMRTMIGMTNGSFFLIRAWRGTDPEEWQGWTSNQPVTFIECDLTPSAKAAVLRLLPDWFQMDIGERLMSGERDIPVQSRDGRYFVYDYVCDNFADALTYAMAFNFPVNQARFEPGPQLIYSNRQSRFGGNPFSLWSDGKIVTSEFNSRDKEYRGQINVSQAASKLLSYALRQRIWRENDAWKQLLMVASYEAETLKEESARGFGWANDKKLERLVTDSGWQLYLVTEAGGAMGEDGDAWDYHSLFADLADAEESYQEIALR